jgi:hypothetical protein
MAHSSPIAASASSWDRSRIALVAIVAIQVVGSLLLNPLGVNEDQMPEWLGLMLLGGIVFNQPVLFGIWAGLGPGGTIRRVLVTSIVLCGILAASCFRGFNLLVDADRLVALELNEWVYFLVLYSIALLMAFSLRWFTGWRISNKVSDAARDRNQISLRFLLVWTAACAVVLTVARTWTDTSEFTRTAAWTDELLELLKFMGLMLLIFFPIVIAPLVVLLPRWSWRAIVAALAVWACLTWLGVETMAAVENDPRSEVVVLLFALQSGCLIVSVASAALLRWAGFRIVKSSLSAEAAA